MDARNIVRRVCFTTCDPAELRAQRVSGIRGPRKALAAGSIDRWDLVAEGLVRDVPFVGPSASAS